MTKLLIALVVLALLAGAIYSNTLSTPFVFDDVRNISENPSVQWRELSWDSFQGTVVNSPASVSKRRPVAFISFGLNHYFGSPESTTGYHLVNLAIHIVNGMLVYLLVYVTLSKLALTKVGDGDSAAKVTPAGLLGDPFLPSLVAACLFVVHPIQTQAITYLVQRMTSMAVLFYLAALLFHIYASQSPIKSRRWACWIVSVICWALALGTKEIAVTLPAAICLYEWCFCRGRDRAWRTRCLAWIGIAAIAIGVMLATGWSTSSGRGVLGYGNRDFTMAERLLTQPRVVFLYISLIVLPLPSRLNLLHDVPLSQSLIAPPTVLLSLIAIVALLAVAVWSWRRMPLVSFGIMWFFLHLVLESTILPLEMVYEHRLYLPMFGVALMVAYATQLLISRRQLWVAIPIVLMVTSLGVATYVRNQDWQSRVTIWSDVIAKSPRLERGFANRGLAYQELGRYDEAIVDYDAAIENKPSRVVLYSNRGTAYQLNKDFERALADYNTAIRMDSKSVAAFNNRGKVQEALGRPQLAIADYTAAIELKPQTAIAYHNRANVFRATGKGKRALEDYTQAIRYGLRSYKVYNGRGTIYMLMGKWDAAIHDFKSAIAVNANDVGSHNNLAWILATCPDASLRDGNQAVTHAKRAAELLGANSFSALDTLAAAYAEAGQFEEAVRVQTHAIQLAPPQAAGDMQKRLDLYRVGKPFRVGK